MFVELLWICMNLSGPQEIFQEDLQPPANSVSGLRVGLIWTNLGSRLWRVWWIWWVWGVWVVHSFLYKGLPHVASAEAPGPDCKETWASRYAPHNWVGPTWMINEEPWMITSKSHLFLKEPCFRSIRCDWEATVLFVFFSCLQLYLFFPSQHVIFTFFLSFRFSTLLSHYPFVLGSLTSHKFPTAIV